MQVSDNQKLQIYPQMFETVKRKLEERFKTADRGEISLVSGIQEAEDRQK